MPTPTPTTQSLDAVQRGTALDYCDCCQGSGKITVDTTRMGDEYPRDEAAPCPACDGGGIKCCQDCDEHAIADVMTDEGDVYLCLDCLKALCKTDRFRGVFRMAGVPLPNRRDGETIVLWGDSYSEFGCLTMGENVSITREAGLFRCTEIISPMRAMQLGSELIRAAAHVLGK